MNRIASQIASQLCLIECAPCVECGYCTAPATCPVCLLTCTCGYDGTDDFYAIEPIRNED